MPALELVSSITMVSGVLFVAGLIVSSLEEKMGGRLFAVKTRDWLDIFFDKCICKLSIWYITITRYKVKLSWYYSLHAVLVTLLVFLAGAYAKIEGVVVANRDKAKLIRNEKKTLTKSHLTEIAEHKVTVQLSKKEQTRRKNASLKGD